MKIGIIGAMDEDIKILREALEAHLSLGSELEHYLFPAVSAIMK